MKLMETTAAVDRKGRLRIPAAILAELTLAPGDGIRVLLSDNSDSLRTAWRALVSHVGPENDRETDGLLLPAKMLENAGFHSGELLEIVCGDRKIEIKLRETESVPADPLDRMPKELRELFEELGVDPDTVRKVMEEGAYFQ